MENISKRTEQFKRLEKLTVEDVVVMYNYAEAIVETVREPLIILDSNYHIKKANQSFYIKFKVNKKEIIGKSLFEIGNKQWNIPELKKLIKEVLPKNKYFNDFQVTHNFENIGHKTMLLNARRVMLDGHRTKLILLAIEDITDRVEIARKLEESEQHYRWIVEQLKDYVIISMDRNGVITDWNPAAENIIGYKKDEVLGKSADIIFTPGDINQKVPEMELKVAKTKGKAIDERWHVKSNKEYFWGSGLVIPITNDEGKLQGFTKIIRDVTTRKENEDLKDDFLSMASHEIKTPITTIKTYAQIMHKRFIQKNDTKNADYIEKIDSQTNKLISLVNDFLDISKIEKGSLSYDKKEFDLNTLIDKIIEDFQYIDDAHQIIKKGNLDSTVFADKERISQVIINLLNNAIKYSPEGKEIYIQIKKLKNHVQISIQDFGIGIPKDQINQIFDKYFQINGNGRVAGKGFGLGLFISSEIIKSHRGKIWVESQSGKGSVFHFTIPVSK